MKEDPNQVEDNIEVMPDDPIEKQLNELIVCKLSKDLKELANSTTPNQARVLVRMYYTEQKRRVANTLRIYQEHKRNGATKVLDFLVEQSNTVEKQMAVVLKCFADNDYMCQWSMQHKGIGPILAAALSANIDIEKAPTVGHIWRFFGNDPTLKWIPRNEAEEIVNSIIPPKAKITQEHLVKIANAINVKGDTTLTHCADMTREELTKWLCRCPWVPMLKSIVWRIGESFVKVCNDPDAYYGKIYNKRKAYEQEKNEAGDYAELAASVLAKRPTHAQRKIYMQGKLPPGHIHARAKRYAAKRFLADWHAEAYRHHFGKEPPLPYPLAILHHAHMDIPKPSRFKKGKAFATNSLTHEVA